MRVSSTQYFTTVNNALQDNNAAIQYVTEQISSGYRIQKPSDDPVGSVRVSRLAREDAALTQYKDNISALSTRLSYNETTLQNMTDDMLQARDTLVWAANGSNLSADLNAMASTLVSLRDAMFFSSNTKDQEGRYLFSGTLTSTVAISYDSTAAVGSRYTFTGNTNLQNVVIGNGITQAANVHVAEMAQLLNTLDTAIAAMQSPTADPNNPATQADLTAGLDAMDTAINTFSLKIADLGDAQNLLQTLDDSHTNMSLSNKQATTLLNNLDYGEASIRLNGYTAALQATQKSYVKVNALSLFNLL